MSLIINNYTYQYITDEKLIQLLDRFSPASTKIPMSALIDQALASGGTPVHFGQTWHVDYAAPAGGDGTAWAPFATVADANVAATAGDKVIIDAGNGVTLLTLPFDATLNYQINGQCIANEITVTGVGVVHVEADDLILTATAIGAICTLGSGQFIVFKDSYVRVIHTLGTPVAFAIPATSSAAGFLMYNSVLREGDGVSDVTLVLCADELSVVLIEGGLNTTSAVGSTNAGTIVTNDAVGVQMDDGSLITSGSTIVNNSAASPAALIANATAGAPWSFFNSRAINLGVGPALSITGDNAAVTMGKLAWCESGGAASVIKSSVLSQLNPVPCSIQAITTADFNALSAGETGIGYVVGNPNTAGPAGAPIAGMAGQIVDNVTTGDRYVMTNDGTATPWLAW